MTKFLLSIHVLAVILAIGPVAVAASMFPAAARRVERESVLAVLHRVCRIYAAVGIVVPVFGIATATGLGVLGDAWLIAAMTLTAAAAGVLVALVLPRQAHILEGVRAGAGLDPRAPARLAARTGLFNLLWAAVTVLMIVRPGSTPGVSA